MTGGFAYELLLRTQSAPQDCSKSRARDIACRSTRRQSEGSVLSTLKQRGSVAGWWTKPSESYAGFSIKSPPGLQPALVNVLARHHPAGGSVLDVGSGSSVMTARLRDAGFTDVHTVARDPVLCGDLRGPEARPPIHPKAARLDVRGDFAAQLGRRFAAVTSSELIEHVPSPRAYLDQVAHLLEPGGTLVLSTPNVANWIGRARFLFFGELRWFDERWSRELNHICPITDAQMRLMLEEAGFELIASEAAGSTVGPLAMLFAVPLCLPFLFFNGRRAWGDCMIYVARKHG